MSVDSPLDATRYGDDVVKHGLSGTHHQVIAWVPHGARVLEVGCSTGYISQILRDEKGCQVTGLEVDSAAAATARKRGFTVLEGSLEQPSFRESIRGPFDVVIAADVLEHLANPAPVLEHFKRWLAPGGVAIIAVPNIATWSMRAQLFFRGDFEYQATGILDRTHLHHFTWETLHKLVKSQGWTIRETMVDGWEIPGAHNLLFKAPLEVLRITGDHEVEPRAVVRWFKRRAFEKAVQVHQFGTKIGKRLIRHFPNLTAPHIALQLVPPTV